MRCYASCAGHLHPPKRLLSRASRSDLGGEQRTEGSLVLTERSTSRAAKSRRDSNLRNEPRTPDQRILNLLLSRRGQRTSVRKSLGDKRLLLKRPVLRYGRLFRGA